MYRSPKCPNCHASMKGRNPVCLSPSSWYESIFDIIQCPDCNHAFRLADGDYGKSLTKRVFRFLTDHSMASSGISSCCPYCAGPIPVGYLQPDGTYPVPFVCCNCGRDLPKFVKNSKPEPQPAKVVAPQPAKVVAPVQPAKVVAPVQVEQVEQVEQVVPFTPHIIPITHLSSTLVSSCKALYAQVVEENGGQDLSDEQFKTLMEKIKK
jgi:hypothetical protein